MSPSFVFDLLPCAQIIVPPCPSFCSWAFLSLSASPFLKGAAGRFFPPHRLHLTQDTKAWTSQKRGLAPPNCFFLTVQRLFLRSRHFHKNVLRVLSGPLKVDSGARQHAGLLFLPSRATPPARGLRTPSFPFLCSLFRRLLPCFRPRFTLTSLSSSSAFHFFFPARMCFPVLCGLPLPGCR